MTASERPIQSAISQLAADWFAAHRGGPLSLGEREEFLGWLKASPIHIEEYLGVAALERTLQDAARDPPMSVAALVELARSDNDATVVDLVPVSPAGPARSPASSVSSAPLRNGWRLWLGAAAVVVMSLGGLYALWQTIADRSPVSKTYVTAHGKQQTWRLSDGSTIHLDTDTAVTVRLSATERLLVLDRGQIAVTVQHDPHRPFHVRAGAADAVAVGTEFDVYRIADSTTVTVLAGLVAVSVPEATDRTVRVGAGQKVSVVDGLLPLSPSPANAREAIAWLSGKIAFERRPLDEVAAEFNRYNSAQFSIDDPELRAMAISGSFDARDADSFADFLSSLDGVRLQRVGANFRVLRAPVGSAATGAHPPL
ncbi:MAG: FecR domain-containing protein [Steroidobacteraceae bacterium]